MDAREQKDQAAALFGKGKFARAAEAYAAYCQAEQKDLQARLRLGDSWAKAGKKDKAILAYTWAAEGFAHDGFLPRAIAASKLVLELDPTHTEVQRTLASLYSLKSSTPSRVARPVPARVTVAAPEATGSGELEPPPPVDPEPAPTLAPTVQPEVELEISLEAGQASSPDEGIDIEVEGWAGAEAPRPSELERVPPAESLPPAPSGLAPGGLPELEQSLQVLLDQADPEAPPALAPAFTELELDEGDSLLHAVAAVAPGPPPPAEEAMEPSEEAQPGALPRVPLFSDLPEEALVALFTRCPLRRYEPGQAIVEQGSRGGAFYVICAGQVRVWQLDAGHRRELATLDEGAFFGEMALLSDAARTATVEASAEDTQVLEIAGQVLTALSRQHPQVSRALKTFCRQRLLSNLMASAPLFRSFGRSDRRDLIQRFRARDVAAGEVIIREGSHGDGLYVVLSGQVEVRVQGVPVALLREGELFGERSLLTHTAAGATVRAARHTSLLRLPREDFASLISSHPQILELVSELTERRQDANARRGLV
jgi:CRP-like cAMP-binding protein